MSNNQPDIEPCISCLAEIVDDLNSYYSREEIALACGYYFTNEKGKKIPLINLFDEALTNIGYSGSEPNMSEENYDLFNGKLIISDHSHGGNIFIPKRIYDEHYLDQFCWEEVDIDWVMETSFCDSEEEAQEEFDKYGFTEKMMAMAIHCMCYVSTKDWWDRKYLSFEELMDYHDIDPRHTHKKSTYADCQ